MSNNQSQQDNPLKQFYRKEKVFVKLPSRGNFYDENVVELNDEGEVGVKPMTAADEIILKNPSALLSGKALTDVIESCVPAAKNPRKLLACDIDTLMIAIREASYGDEANLEINCPECDAKNTYNLDLDVLLNSAEQLESSYEVVLDNNLTVYVRPGDFTTMNKQNKALFESSKVQKALGDTELTEEAGMNLLASAYSQLTKINFELIRDSIHKIVFTDEEDNIQEITNKKHIEEFIHNIDKKLVDQIEEKIEKVNKVGIARTTEAICTSCEHKWDAPIEFNPVNFS